MRRLLPVSFALAALLGTSALAEEVPTTTTPEPPLEDPAATRAAAPLGVSPTEPRLAPAAFRGAPPRFATPRGGSARARRVAGGVRITLRRADGTRFAEADGDDTGYRRLAYFDARGRVYFTAEAVLAGRPRPAREQARCGRDESSPSGARVQGVVRWRFNAGSTPRNLSAATVQQHLRNAHAQWAGNRNHCRLPDRSGLRFAFAGRTSAAVGLNGVNSIGFGDPSALGCTQARTLGCALNWYRNGTLIVESDIRLATRPPGGRGWATTRRAGFFDVWSVAAHEIGHRAGFGHTASASADNIMFPTVAPGDVTNRLLGRGDATANNRVY